MSNFKRRLFPRRGAKHIDDILRELADTSDYGYVELRDLWQRHKDYVKELVNDPDVHRIQIPKLGTLYFNVNEANYHVKKNPHLKKKIDEIQVLREKHESTTSAFKKYLNYTRSSLRNLARAISLDTGEGYFRSTKKHKQRKIVETYTNSKDNEKQEE